MIEAVGDRAPPPADSFPYEQHLVTPGIDAARQHGGIGLVFVDGPQLAPQQPHRRIEPLQAPCQVGRQHIERVVQADMGLFVGEDRRAVPGQIGVGDHDEAAPAERRDLLRETDQHRAVVQPFAAPPADHPHDGGQRPQRPQTGRDGSRQEEHADERPPRKRRRSIGRHWGGKRIRDEEFGGHGQFAADRDHAQRQQERKEDRPQHHDPVEAVEGLAAQQQLEKEVENGQTDTDFQAVKRQFVPHGYRMFWRSMRSISSRSSSTERRSSSTSAETAPRQDFSK